MAFRPDAQRDRGVALPPANGFGDHLNRTGRAVGAREPQTFTGYPRTLDALRVVTGGTSS